MASLRPFNTLLRSPAHPLLSSLMAAPSRGLPFPRRSTPLRHPPRRFYCRAAAATSVERSEEKKEDSGESGERRKIRIRVLLAHQVKFGQHVGVVGSTEELGSWQKHVAMEWTPDGWACDLVVRGGVSVEFKFVILWGGKKDVVWERGDNRVLVLPEEGGFSMVCRWNETGEALKLQKTASLEEGEKPDSGDGNEFLVENDGLESEVEASPFIEQWQGKAASFMRSNEHRNRETQRVWRTDGLDGVALKLVEGDRSARNWWRKVHIPKSGLPTYTFFRQPAIYDAWC